MALDTITLKNSLKTAFLANLPSPTPGQVSEVDTLAGAVAAAMQAFVTGATITYTTGLTSPSGAVTGVFTNIIS